MSTVKAGGVFVEIGADPRKFFSALNRVNKAMANMGRSLSSAGARVGGMGVATLAPFAAAVRQGAAYQSTLLNIQASTGATAAELEKLKAASMQMSAAMGVGPTQIAGSFLELLKAGMSVEQVLGGAGQAAIEFAAVGQMDVAAAAVVMADAMNVFGVDAAKAANSISSAADASSTSIELMSQSFAQVSAVAALANQSIDQTSAALAILANSGVKGSDAGTSLKTMLMRLMAPADDAVGALTQLGLNVQSFRNADGTMKPLVDIIGVLNGALGNMDQAAKDDIFRRIFGQDAIRAAAVLTNSGVEGFNAMTGAMGAALPVSEKYKTILGGLAGAGGKVMAAMERFAIAVSDSVAPAIMSAIAPIVGFINGLADLASKNQEAVAMVAKFGVAALAIGGVLTGLGLSLQVAAFGFGGILKTVSLVSAPLQAVGSMVMFVGMSFYKAIAGVLAYSTASVAAAVASGAAWAVANAPLLILIGLLGAAGAAVLYAMGGFEGIASAIGGGFSQAMAGGMVLLSDLSSLAQTTFNGIYDAIAAGDLSGAMEILWAGMKAIWMRGTQWLVNNLYTAIGEMKKAFVTVGSAWDKYVTKPISMFGVRVAEAGQERAVLGAFDVTQGTIFDNESKKAARARKKSAEDLLSSSTPEDFEKNKATAKATMESLQGVVDQGLARGATDEQKKAGEAAAKEIAAYRDAIDLVRARFAQLGIKTEDQRQSDLEKAKAEIDAATKESIDKNNAGVSTAAADLNAVSPKVREKRARNGDFAALLKEVESASSLDQLRDLYGQYDALSSNGRLTTGQASALETALEDAQERVSKASSSMGGKSAQQQVEQGAAGAGLGGPTQAEVAGTFSSVALGGMGFGGSLSQKQLDALNQIARNTDPQNADKVAA